MTINWPMLLRAAHQLTARNPGPLSDLAHETIEVAPEETAPTQPAIYPDGAMDKITGLSPWRSWPDENELITGAPRHHVATKAFVVDDVIISGPFVYKGAARYDPGYGEARLWQPSVETRKFDEAVLVSSYAGSRFFGPFLKDSLPQELLPDDGAQKIAMRTRPYDHEAGYRALFDLPAPPLVERARVRRLTYYQDFGQNAGKAARYQMLHDRLRANAQQGDRRSPVGVYLKRGQTGETRILANESALERCLADIGFDIIEPAHLEADEIARRTLDAPIVVSVEGSHISHVSYSMAPTGTLLVLQPPDRFAMAFKEFTDCVGIRFAFVVCDPAKDGFEVDIDGLRRFMDRLM